MGAIGARIQADVRHPALDDACVPSGTQREEPFAAAGRTPGQRNQGDIRHSCQFGNERQLSVGQLTTSGIRYVGPNQRHTGEDHAIVAARHTV